MAIALHTATGGLPIEALFRGEGPKHAVVVDGATTLDAFGRRLLRHARAGFDEWRDVTPDGLLALLAALPDGDKLMEFIAAADVQLAAESAARFIMDAVA